MSLGDAWVDVHANTRPFKREVDDDLRRAGHDADAIVDQVGKDWGTRMSRSMSEEIRDSVPELGRAVERETEHVRVKVRWQYDYDRNGILKGARKIVTEIEDAVSKGFNDAVTRRGGLFDSLSSGIRDAVGAGFNVSGKSPLIVLLIPLIGAITGLIVGAIQAANSLVAVLVTVPALIGSIALQAGVLYAVFSGLAKPIQAAFAAKNVAEFNAAIKGLSPAAQGFVRSLLPVRDLFRDLKSIAQSAFFTAFGNSISKVVNALGPLLRGGFSVVATALGNLFAQLANFFASPVFVKFVQDIIPATLIWLQRFGPSFVSFLTALILMANVATPFLVDLGTMLSGTFTYLAGVLTDLVKSGDFKDWLISMRATFHSVMEFVGQAIRFIAVFLAQLDKAGGRKIIDELANDIEMLANFLASPVGQRAMEGLVDAVIMAIHITTGLIEAVFLLLAAFRAVEEFFRAIPVFLSAAGKAIGSFFEWIGGKILGFFRMVGGAIMDGVHAVGEFFSNLVRSVKEHFAKVIDTVKGIPDLIVSAVGNLGKLLYDKGRSIISGLIDGIKSMWGDLVAKLHDVAGLIGGFFGNSPAKYGPLSGDGWTERRGRRLVRALNDGIRAESQATMHSVMSSAVSNINVGAVNLNFSGARPTEEDARKLGAAAAGALTSQMAARDTRLAIRSA